MKRLLPYYERELATLNDLSREFSEQYPALAGHLGMSNGYHDDPSIGQLVQAIALLNARTAMRLDDGHAEFTESLLQVNAPNSLQPFPSSAIAHFDMAGARKHASVAVIERGAMLNAAEWQGVVCRFRTVFDVALLPLAVVQAAFHPVIPMPLPLLPPADVTSSIRIDLTSLAPSLSLAELAAQARRKGSASLRLFVDADPALAAAVCDTLLFRTRYAYVQAEDDAQWRELSHVPLRDAGFCPENAMLPHQANMHPAWRLLTEYFACPEKFNFIEIDLGTVVAALPQDCRRATLHLGLTGIRHDADIAHLLRPLCAAHFVTNCTPVINLFPQAAVPIQVDHTSPDYVLAASAENPHAYDIHSIETMCMLRQSGRKEEVIAFYPYYSLRHGEAGGKCGRYWMLRRDEVKAHTHPGYEHRIAFVDLEMNPLALEAATVSATLNCTNRDFPHSLPLGLADGELRLDGAPDTCPIRLLRKPTLPCRLSSSAHWRLISQLSLNLHALLAGGLSTLKEMLLMHDLRQGAATRRLIDGLQSWSYKRTRHWMPDERGGSFVFGIEIRVALDPAAFAGASIYAFIRALDGFLGQHAPLNSFTQLVAVDHTSGTELIRCHPRCGDIAIA